MDEFSLITSYFQNCGRSEYAIETDIGDDAAIVKAPDNQALVMTMDTLIEGVHFPKNTTPQAIAHKALAVNVSDLAAMGATPAWFLLSISLPTSDAPWLQAFAESLKQLATRYNIKLIGGDTCRGALSITIQATGIQQQSSLLRSNAQLGDTIFVSGELGKAALGLASIQQKITLDEPLKSQCEQALNYPEARLDVAHIIKPYAHAMIDLSDGLVSDLGHILTASKVGASLRLQDIPMPDLLRNKQLEHHALAGGDDYELCFTVPNKHIQAMQADAQAAGLKLFAIGEITEQGLQIINEQGDLLELDSFHGFNHFG